MIVQKLLTKNRYSRVGKPLNKMFGVVVHYVGVNGQRPEDTVAYFESLKNGTNQVYASAHYVIGTDGNGVQCIPDTEVAYHCGAKEYREGIVERLSAYPNYTTVGIEMCHNANGFTEETLDTTAKLVAQILVQNDLEITDVYRHYDITGKMCPKFFVDDESQWNAFKNRIKGYMT